jgi:hypothetical protein
MMMSNDFLTEMQIEDTWSVMDEEYEWYTHEMMIRQHMDEFAQANAEAGDAPHFPADGLELASQAK